MSSASAADCTHWRANRSNPGATSQKQFLQFSWLAMGSMTFSRSLLSRRRQVEILSVSANKKESELAEPTAPGGRALPALRFWNCAQNQIAEPVWMGDSGVIRSKRFHRRIDAEIAVRAVGVLPALVPVKRCFDSRITGAKQVQTLFDPRRFADSAGWRCGKRKFAGRPFRNHDGLVRIETAHFLVRPVDQGRNIRIGLVLVLLAI